MTPYTVQRGETMSLACDYMSGVDPLTVTSAVGAMKRLLNNVVSGNAIALSVVYAAAGGGEPARWNVTLLDTSALESAVYQVDVLFTVASGKVITNKCLVRIEEAAVSP